MRSQRAQARLIHSTLHMCRFQFEPEFFSALVRCKDVTGTTAAAGGRRPGEQCSLYSKHSYGRMSMQKLENSQIFTDVP